MEEPILNRVQASGLVQVDLASLVSVPPASEVDLAQWLDQGWVLREKPFREAISAWDTAALAGHVVGLHCTSEAILPEWAWMLVTAKLQGVARDVVHGDVQAARARAWSLAVNDLDLSPFHGQRVIVKGCGHGGGPGALMAFVARAQPVVKSLMFGEACSAVPIFKAPSDPKP